MILLVAKSTFLYQGDLHKPGDVLQAKEEDAPEPLKGEERPAEHFLETNLCELPSTAQHEFVELVEEGGDEFLLCSHGGGGWYTVTDRDGLIWAGTIQGREKALERIEEDFSTD